MAADATLLLASGLGMLAVALAAVIAWRRISHARYRWFWIGAALWTVAVAIKVVWAVTTNAAVISFLKSNLSYPLLVVCGGVYGGIQSSVCEMGITLLAVWIWRQLGEEPARAIALGVGAGAFEASLLGLGHLAAAAVLLAGATGTEIIGDKLDMAVAVTPLLWLVAPVERVIAILCHASTRALIVLGVARHRPLMIIWGFAIFTVLDGIVAAIHFSETLGTFSYWWVELMVLPLVVISIPILGWCYKTFSPDAEATKLADGELSPPSQPPS